jgi:hypothetical protein
MFSQKSWLHSADLHGGQPWMNALENSNTAAMRTTCSNDRSEFDKIAQNWQKLHWRNSDYIYTNVPSHLEVKEQGQIRS